MLFLSRRGISAALLLAIVVAVQHPAVAQGVTVRINGQPLYLNPGPIERAGRVFVPLRGIFERLGATVVYASGEINATKGRTTVALRIGSTAAVVSGQPQTLDVAPFIVGATTYVPLRFIAQSLGAEVGYNDSSQVVSIAIAAGVPVEVRPPVRPAPPPYPPPSAVQLRVQQPPPDAVIDNRFHVIAAQFSMNVQAASVRVLLDGNDVTYRTGMSATGFSYKPPAPLEFGSHTVRVSGRGPGGRPFDRSWSFSVRRSGPPPPMRLTISQPASNAAVGRTFTIAGNTVSNGRVRVTAGATPSFNGQFNGTTTAGPRGNFNLTVTLRTMPGQQAVSLRVIATDPSTSQSTQTTLQLRLNL